MNDVKTAYDFDIEVDKLNRKYQMEYCTDASFLSCQVLELLEKIMDDTSEMISYFVWELDFGDKYTPNCVLDNNNNAIDISTIEKLYDYLISDN